MPVWLVSGEDSLSGLQITAFSITHVVLPRGEREKVSSLVSISSLTLLVQSPNFMTSFNLHYFLRGPSPNTAMLGVRISTYQFLGDIQSIAEGKELKAKPSN